MQTTPTSSSPHGASQLTPLVLLVDDQEWTSRSLESVLRPRGYVFVSAYTGRQGLELAAKVDPDAVMVDLRLPDMDGPELVRQLRQGGHLPATTPLFFLSTRALLRAERVEALAAGAWDILRIPMDPDELVLRLEPLIRAKSEADFLRREGLVDHATGTYNARGLMRRTEELSAEAARFEEPMAVVALGPEWRETGVDQQVVRVLDHRLARVLRSAVRASDTVGRYDTGEFTVVAPKTDRDGALRLAERIFDLLGGEPAQEGEAGPAVGGGLPVSVRAGLHASAGKAALDPSELLANATRALRRAQLDPGGPPLRVFEA